MGLHTSRLALALLMPALLSARPAESQSLPPWLGAAPPTGLIVQVGLEPQLVVSTGYLWGVHAGGHRSHFGVGTGLKVAPYLLKEGALRVHMIVAGRWQADSNWGATGTTQLYLARSRNRTATAHGLGMEVRLAPGRHGDRWGLAADLGWQGTLITHIRHGEEARETFEERYPDHVTAADGPVDGWYGSTAHRFRIGFLTSRNVSDGLDVQAAAGSLFSLQRQGILLGFAHGQVPAYLEAAVRWAR